ncbi:unnamed protein product [Closterium sp. NIES-54]
MTASYSPSNNHFLVICQHPCMLCILGPPIVLLVPARSALALSGPARTVSRCPAATRTACPRTSRPAAACESRPAALPCARRPALHPAPSCPAAHASRCPALRPARCLALQRASRTALPCSPARHALLPCPARAPLSCVSRPAAARTSRPTAPRVAPSCSPRVALCCPARRALLQPARRALLQPTRRALLPCTACALLPCPPRALPWSPRHALPYPPAPPSPAEPRHPARAALTNPSRAALPHSPAPLSHPAATTAAAAAAARVTAAGAGGAAGSAGGAVGARGAGPTTDRHCLSWPLSRQLQRLGVDSNSHCLSWTTPPLSSFSTFSLQRPRDCAPQRCVPGCVEAAALGSSKSAAAQGAGESATALGAHESADALGASASTATGPASAEALHTFTLDSSASHCFFRDCTTDEWVDTFIPGGQSVAICKFSRTGRHLATFTRQPGSSLYTLTIASAQVAESGKVAASNRVSASGQLASSCLCRVLSHQNLLWHHRLGHPSLPRLRSMHSRLIFFGLSRSLPSLARSPALPCLPCVEGQQRAAPHSSEFPPTTAPLQTLHMDVWGPALVGGMGQERYLLLIVDNCTCYTTVFPLRCKADVSSVLIP